MESMVRTREIINVIVEDILRPNINDPVKRERGEFIFSDFPDMDDDQLKIGVDQVSETGTEMKTLSSTEKYRQSRIRASVQMKMGFSTDALDDNFTFPDEVEKPEDAIDWLANRVRELVVEEANKSFENSKIRQLGGSDEDVVVQYDQTTPFFPSKAIKRLQVDFLAEHE